MIRKGKKTVDFVIKCTIIYLAAVLGSWIMITCGFITPWREKFMLIEWKLFSFMILNSLSHYQKIDKYKRKYWGNIPRELPWKKKLKQSKKKWWRVIFTNGITDGICVLRRWKNSVGKTVKSCSEHCSFISKLNVKWN